MKKNKPAKRGELVTWLKTLSEGELSAYCSGVLAGWSNSEPEVLGQVVAAIKAPKPPRRGFRRVSGVVRKSLPDVLCGKCGAVVPRTGQAGRPRATCRPTCPGADRRSIDLRLQVSVAS